jgi:hypothetical protein
LAAAPEGLTPATSTFLTGQDPTYKDLNLLNIRDSSLRSE